MATTFWSDEKLAILRDGLAQGLLYSQIAAAVGCSTAAVAGKLSRLGMQRGPTGVRRQAVAQRIERSAVRKQRIARDAASEAPALQPDLADQMAVHNMSLEELHRDPADLVPLLELQPQHCRYPIGDRPVRFCGAPKVLGLSYCPFHAAKCCPGIELRGRRLHCERAEAVTRVEEFA